MIDPIDICNKHDILIISEPLGNVLGYYEKLSGQPIIHINENVLPYYRHFVIAYLLYGFIFNPNEPLFFKPNENDKDGLKFAIRLTSTEEERNNPDLIIKRLKMKKSDIENMKELIEIKFGKLDGTPEEQIKYVLEQLEQ